MAANLRLILVFIGFVGFSYIVLKSLFRYCTNHGLAPFVLPGVAVFGVLSAWVFLGWKLTDFFLWHLVFVGFLFFHWYRANNMQTARLTATARQTANAAGADESEVLNAFLLTRWYLRLSMAIYLAAFTLGFAYFYSLGRAAPPG
jgi:hypothetical protein